MYKYNVALVKPPLIAHQKRGTGVYTDNLFKELKNKQKMNVFFVELNGDFSKYDLIHYPYFDPFFLTLPFLKRKPTVVTVHDLIPLKYPQYFPKGYRGTIKWFLQSLSLGRSDSIITDSLSSKKDIQKLTNIDEKKIKVIYLAAGEEFKKITAKVRLQTTKRQHNFPDDFILYVGDVNYNKNVSGLIKSFSIIKKNFTSLKLVLVGQGFVNRSEQLLRIKDVINQYRLNDSVLRITNLEVKDLVNLYNLAKVYVQLSYSEGFGLPLLEAMNCGCPVVCSNRSSLAEITAGAALLVDPDDYKNVSEKVSQILEDKNFRENLVKKGYEKAGEFSWKKCAEETLAVYQEILRERYTCH